MEVKDLENKIKYYSEKYYQGVPEISDDAFDALVDQLRTLNPNSYILNTGWGFEVQGNKVKHKYSHIGSLDKCKTYEEIPDRFKTNNVFVSPKLDGLSAVAYYKNGILTQGITRGNGSWGKDITEKLRIILGNEIPDKSFTGGVRGEIILAAENCEILNNKYSEIIAPRNFAAGIVNRKEIDEDIKYLDLVTYKIVGQENSPILSNRHDILNWLKQNFKKSIPEYYFPLLNEATWSSYHEKIFEDFKGLGYQLDGLVLTKYSIPYDEQNKSYMYDEVAFKFQSETCSTKVKEIEWNLSRTQRLVPVAIVEPVELAGAKIQRATGNNAKMVQDLGLGRDAEIIIQRSGEVIPKIIEIINPSDEELPTKCPVCGSKLIWDGVDLKCNNKQCPNINLSDLQQWCEIIGETDGLQWTLMKQYLDIYGVTSVKVLYEKLDFIIQDMKIRSLSITEQKVYEFFSKLYAGPVEADRAINALNIPRLGDKTSKLLVTDKHLVLDLLDYCNLGTDENIKERLMNLIKEANTVALLDNLDKYNNLSYLFSNNNKTNRLVFPDVKTDNIKYIAVTGALTSMKRKDFEKHISNYGYELSSNLKKCEYLVTNDPNSGSTKNKQAQQYGVTIITEQDFLNTLK